MLPPKTRVFRRSRAHFGVEQHDTWTACSSRIRPLTLTSVFLQVASIRVLAVFRPIQDINLAQSPGFSGMIVLCRFSEKVVPKSKLNRRRNMFHPGFAGMLPLRRTFAVLLLDGRLPQSCRMTSIRRMVAIITGLGDIKNRHFIVLPSGR